MGNCCSQESEGRYQQQGSDQSGHGGGGGPGQAPKQATGLTRVTMRPTAAQQQQQRETTWRSTGIVALRDGKLTALPQFASHADTARVLDATNNKIVDIQPLSALVNLQRLTLASNLIAVLPGDVLGAMQQLKLLVLDNNRLTALPLQLGSLTKLEKLTVGGNQLTSVPPGSLPLSLQVLSLANNQLSELPDAQLPTELEELDASGNRIKAIPVGFQVLAKLKILTLDGNQIADVPSEVLTNCVSMHTLSLHNNPITPDALQSNPAFEAFEQRRRSKYDKVIQGGVLIGNKGLDEGVDRKLAK